MGRRRHLPSYSNLDTELCCSPNICMFFTSVAPFKRAVNRRPNDTRFIFKKHVYNNESAKTTKHKFPYFLCYVQIKELLWCHSNPVPVTLTKQHANPPNFLSNKNEQVPIRKSTHRVGKEIWPAMKCKTTGASHISSNPCLIHCNWLARQTQTPLLHIV